MSISSRRVRAIFGKELREYRHNGNIIVAMVIFPKIFLIQPLLTILTQAASASSGLAHEHVLLYMLAIPALVPAALASYSVVGERQQGTLEPVLATPIRREEFLLGKALAAFVPSLAISYAVFALFLACVEIFAQPGSSCALRSCSPSCSSRRSSPHGRSGSASRSQPDRATYALPGSSACSPVSRRSQ